MFELEPGLWLAANMVTVIDINKGTVRGCDIDYTDVPAVQLMALLEFIKKMTPSLSIEGQAIERSENKKMNYQL